MTATLAPRYLRHFGEDRDERVLLRGLSWEQLETILAIRGETPRPRFAYLDGCLELMTTSRAHEYIKKTLARLVEQYALERNIECTGYGNLTLKRSELKRGIEPDESYIFGNVKEKEYPDLAIEVIWTHGGLDRLEIYRGLGVREVWL